MSIHWKTLARRLDEVHAEPVCAAIESMTGARLVHDTLEACGWDVEIADAQRVKGLAPLACKTDKTDSLVLATALAARPGGARSARHRPLPGVRSLPGSGAIIARESCTSAARSPQSR